MARTSINEELWRIFSFYSLECGDKNDPEHLDSSQFLRFCQCCELVDDSAGMSEADINLMFTTQTKKDSEEAAKHAAEKDGHVGAAKRHVEQAVAVAAPRRARLWTRRGVATSR